MPPPLLINSLLPCKRKLGLNWRFDASILPEALRELNPQKTIVINPYAQSIRCDIALFELIAERAAQMGYTALCHVHWGQKGLNACASVECTLKEIGTFLASGATLIALRSGFVDTMLHAGCKIVSLLPKGTPFGWRLEGSDAVALINPNVADVVINEDDYSATVDKVFLRLAELAQKERARCSTT